MSKKVYVGMAADFIHGGHLNIINVARELGEVTVGVLTDSAIAKYRRLPLLTYEQRREIMLNIRGVKEVIPQDTVEYTNNLESLRPNYVIHGTDWKTGPLSGVRKNVIETLKQWGGELIEPEYTTELSSTHLTQTVRKFGTTPDMRMKSLRRLINAKPLVRILEVHNGLTGLIAENTHLEINDELREFDGMWESSLTDSTSKGKPDTSAVDISSRVSTIDQILEVTTKPMVVDADNGGLTEHFTFTVRTLERLGVSAVIIEDKIGAKRNSLFGTDAKQKQDTISDFSHKISKGKQAQVTEDFMIIARIESLILKTGLEDALTRARSYIEAGADGIMIHSKEKTPQEILAFCNEYKKFDTKVPLVVVPSTYSTITEDELIDAGVKIVIYANHLLRSAFPAMQKTAQSILTHKRCFEASEACMPIKEIITLIPETI
ncbi:MAG: phosphoenolpyruvate mutase [Bacteriovoracaceae bacterium]|nr:phosphoenolpyruvate mutase [Bacteriovoracaceae bacterium]